MNGQLPVVVLVGRPNVGKSTLFNRVTHSRDAIVADRPGVTRDRQYGYAAHAGRRFLVVDTGGLGVDDQAIDRLAARQTDTALAQAHAVLLLVDGAAGRTGDDEVIARRLRRLALPIFPVVNKSEGRDADSVAAEFHALGLGSPQVISAARGDRVGRLLDNLIAVFPAAEAAAPAVPGIRMAVLGRPNAGKSTLVNRLLGEDRMLAMEVPGTTRDAVAAGFELDGERFTVVDTAGVRRRSRIRDPLEKFSVVKALQAAEAADVVVVLIDARSGLGVQDSRLLSLVVERGRAGVIAVNKWDGLAPERRNAVREDLRRRLPHMDFLPLCFISARHGSGLAELMDAVRAGHAAAGADLSTPALTRVLEAAVAAHPPPALHGRRVKLRYAHQGGRKPPCIVVHGSQTDRLSAEYKRYLVRCLRAAFELTGTPLQLVFRTGDNPFGHKAGDSRQRRWR